MCQYMHAKKNERRGIEFEKCRVVYGRFDRSKRNKKMLSLNGNDKATWNQIVS